MRRRSAIDAVVGAVPDARNASELRMVSAWLRHQAKVAAIAAFGLRRVRTFGPWSGGRLPVDSLYSTLTELARRGIVRWDETSARPYAGEVRYRRFFVNRAMLGLEDE